MPFMRSLMATFLLLGLVACDPPPPPPAPAVAKMAMAAPAPLGAAAQNGAKLAYSHNLTMQMPDSSIQPRFDRARDLCLQSATLHCILRNASLTMGQPNILLPTSASLSVRLPHDQVTPFINGLLAAVPGDLAAATVTARSTQADDLTKALVDVGERQKQLLDYRDRLLALEKIPDAKVDDLIKIASEISGVQSRLEAIAAEQATLNERVDTEEVDVRLVAEPAVRGVLAPVAKVWLEAGELLGNSVANALRFVIQVLPWLPVVAVGLWVVISAIRRVRRR